MPTRIVRIVLADDHQIVRQGVRAVIEREGFQVVAEASDGREAMRCVEVHSPDIAILDLAMPHLNGLDAAREILQTRPLTAIILLTMHAEEHQVVAALRNGIRGYIVKTQAAE